MCADQSPHKVTECVHSVVVTILKADEYVGGVRHACGVKSGVEICQRIRVVVISRMKEPLLVRCKALLIDSAAFLQSSRNWPKLQRIALNLFVLVKGAAPILCFRDAGRSFRSFDHHRRVAIAVNCEINTFQRDDRVCQSRRVIFTGAEQGRIPDETEGWNNDSPARVPFAETLCDEVTASAQVCLKIDAPVLLQGHAMIREEDDLRLSSAPDTNLFKYSVERFQTTFQRFWAADV